MPWPATVNRDVSLTADQYPSCWNCNGLVSVRKFTYVLNYFSMTNGKRKVDDPQTDIDRGSARHDVYISSYS